MCAPLPRDENEEDGHPLDLSHLETIICKYSTLGRLKRAHETTSSDSNREHVLVVPYGSPKANLHMVLVDPTIAGWTKVKKRKGRKVGLRITSNPKFPSSFFVLGKFFANAL